MAELRRGQTVGKWRLIRRVGGGGNGVVWCAADESGEVAIKFLTAKGRVRHARFRQEIQFLLDNPQQPGILPIISHDLGAEPPWYAMPLATALADALGKDPSPGRVLEAILAIATTLAELAESGTGHRDIKPDNLFVLDGNYVVGDFGLVAYPGRAQCTKHGRKLGPVEYMAPEMWADADTADPLPADVYSLGKTLWVLLTGKEHPLLGPHRLDDENYALCDRISFEYAPELDLLLEAATRVEPSSRVSMAEFRDELRACLAPRSSHEGPDVTKLTVKIAALTAQQRRLEAIEAEHAVMVNDSFRYLQDQALRPAYGLLTEHLKGFKSRYTTDVSVLAELPGNADRAFT